MTKGQQLLCAPKKLTCGRTTSDVACESEMLSHQWQ